MFKIIYKYLISNFLKCALNVMLIFLSIGIILNLIEEIEFFKEFEQSLTIPMMLTLMILPNLIMKLLPFIIFIATTWFVLNLRSSSDLLSLKVFGFSNAKIIFILSTAAMFLGFFILVTINPITSKMVKYYESTKSEYSRDIDHLVVINKNGVWIKEVVDQETRIINSKSIAGNFLNKITIYNLDDNQNIVSRIEAEKVDVSSKSWFFKKAKIYDFKDGVNVSIKENFLILSKYDIKNIRSLYKNIDTISFLNLFLNYEDLVKKGYSNEMLDLKLHSFFSLPIFLFLMVVLACVFTIGSLKKSAKTYHIFISILTCVIIYYFKDLSLALGETNKISMILSVWIPIIAIGLFCSIGLLQINEK